MSDLAITLKRTSTDKQDTSIEVQERALDAFVTAQGWECPPELRLSDPDTSGTIPLRQRDGGGKALDYLAHGWNGRPVTRLIVSKVDRLGRHIIDMLMVYEWMQKRDLDLIVLQMGAVPVTKLGTAGKATFAVACVFAEMEAASIRERITNTFKEHRLQDRMTSGTVPYGWRLVMQDGSPAVQFLDRIPLGPDAKGEMQFKERRRWPAEARLAEDPAEMLWKRQIHAWAEGGMPLTHIARALNAAGVRTKTGKEWARSSVERILERELPAAAISHQPSAISKAA